MKIIFTIILFQSATLISSARAGGEETKADSKEKKVTVENSECAISRITYTNIPNQKIQQFAQLIKELRIPFLVVPEKPLKVSETLKEDQHITLFFNEASTAEQSRFKDYAVSSAQDERNKA
ncbi:MAG: hypothetical protein BGO07_02035 [Alphaproteobacteria bacterium 40-19]|nr:MAG: hypothetical protein BGO07_02035 [Alphaproteobacteria bacterium 40-19]